MTTWWEQLAQGIRLEIGTLPPGDQVVRIVVRLLVAGILGALLGFEREHTGKAAGIRTHILVALGSALLVLAGKEAGMTTADLSRIIQGLITGIGFLGAGTILKHAEEGHVRGLTTAAGIWLTAAVGMAAGLGQIGLAIFVAFLALLVLIMVPHVGPSQPREP
jgi:putative Mg2+ transporter-C (MgtC) family protein